MFTSGEGTHRAEGGEIVKDEESTNEAQEEAVADSAEEGVESSGVDPEVQGEASDKGVAGTGEGTEGEVAAKTIGAGNATPGTPPATHTPTSADGLPPTTTTGDAEQDYRGPDDGAEEELHP
jgi:hypothetical protein